MKTIILKTDAELVFRAACSVFRAHGHFLAGLVALLGFAAPLAAADAPKPAGNLADLSIEELMQIPVTSVAKREQKLSQAPAAIHVITAEDIRRSGATSLPEALRLAPGVSVARINGSRWSVSTRGFGGSFAPRLLVLVDGRSVYSPFFSGVNWDAQDYVLEDIERIEVIRGPGATLWGANAVNGVINITTKRAQDTQGGLLTVGGGNVEHGSGALRYGAHPTENLFYRVYVKGFNEDGFTDAAGRDTPDDWRSVRTGFRADWNPPGPNAFTFSGDYYHGRAGERLPTNNVDLTQTVLANTDVIGGNLLGRWVRTLGADADLTVQFYYDHNERHSQPNVFFDALDDTLDLDAHHRFAFGPRQTITWGAGYRLIMDQIAAGSLSTISPARRNRQLPSAFVQDEIELVPDRLRLTLGCRLEHHDYTGLEVQPGARLVYTPGARHTFWGSVARAVRAPSRVDRDVNVIAGTKPAATPPVTPFPYQLNVVSDPNFESEELLAYELGWRWLPAPRLSLDTTAFYHAHDSVRAGLFGPTAFAAAPAPHLQQNITLGNGRHGEAYGAEISAQWQVTENWRLGANYSWFQLNLYPNITSAGTDFTLVNPQSLFGLQSHLALPAHLELDTAAYYNDELANQNIPGYVRLDARLGWRPTKQFEASVGVQNLLDDRHPEFGQRFVIGATEIPRIYYGKLTWRF